MFFAGTWRTFWAQAQKTKKRSPRKKSLIFPEIELCSSNIKIIIIFQEMKPCTFGLRPQSSSLKDKIFFPKKKPLWKYFLCFLKRKFFLYFCKWNSALFIPSSKNKKNPLQEKFLIFQETESHSLKKSCSYISGKQNPEKKLYFRRRRPQKIFLYFLYFRARKMKKLLIFQEMELFNPKLKKVLHIRKEL